MIDYKVSKQGIDVVDTVLTNRELTLQQVKNLLNPSNESVESPMLLKNMDKAIDKVIKAMKENKSIMIPIDSDCDGWCSAGQLYHYIKYTLDYDNIFYIFHSGAKDHGFTDFIVKKIKELKVDLVIMADGGSGDDDRKKYHSVLENGTEIVILDHHDFEGEYQEEVALVNCHQVNQEAKNVNLSGAGVTHKFLQALALEIGNVKDVERYKDLVALSLVSDLMDLREDENRFLLVDGSQEINIKSPFIKKAFEKKKMEKYLSIEELGFNIAPLINATVRIGKKEDKEKVFKSLFISEPIESEKRGEKGKGIFVPIEDEAYRIATNMKSNQDKKRDKGMTKLLEVVEKNGLNNGKSLIVDVTNFIESEIAGLVANKVLDIFNKPIILFRFNKKCTSISASVRGVSGNSEVPSFKKIILESRHCDFCSGHDNAFGLGISLPQSTVSSLKKQAKGEIEVEFGEKVELGELSKTEITKMTNSLQEQYMKDMLVESIYGLKDYIDKRLKGVEFYDGFVVDGEYERAIPLAHVKAIAQYEDLWCNSIKAPLFIVKGVKLDTQNIEKIGNATYTFKVGDVKFTKNYGSRAWYASIILASELPFGGSIKADIICKFRVGKKGYYWCDIVHMDTKQDYDVIDF